MNSGSCMSESQTHILLFPFLAKGHIIPMLDLARRLVGRPNTIVTLFTTPSTLPFISSSLSEVPPEKISLVTIPFPRDIPGVPPHVECMDQLPTMSLYPVFASATSAMQPDFEESLRSLSGPPATFLISGTFLWWTLESASKFGIPRVVFYAIGNYPLAVSQSVNEDNLLHGRASDDEPFAVTAFPWIKLTRNDFPNRDRKHSDFFGKGMLAASQSYGMVVNSFKELEPVFLEKWNANWRPKAWCVGPLCPLAPPKPSAESGLMKWLDEKLVQGRRVLYVAFGSQSDVSGQQIKEIEVGLVNSGVSFLWVMKRTDKEEGADDDEDDDDDGGGELVDFGGGVRAKVKGEGVLVKGWVDQRVVLAHGSVQGFMSHCGWNSTLESICAGVPLLAFPLMMEQPLNARLVVEELGVGLRVDTANGSAAGFVRREGVERTVRELMEGEKGETARRRVAEFAEMARKAVEVGGSSWTELEDLITEVSEESRRMAEKRANSI